MASLFSSSFDILFCSCRAFQSLPDLPEFPLSLKPDDYELPNVDASWDSEDCQPQIQSLKAHLKDEEDDEMGTE